MQRDIYKSLINWKNDKKKQPLIIRGARQIGKSFIVNQFGRKEFSSFIVNR